MVKVRLSLKKTQYHFNMMGPWISSPYFMGLLEDNYLYEERQQDTLSQEILQDKNHGKTKTQSESLRKNNKRFS